MAAARFDDLDEDQRALHETWDDVGRVVLLVILTAAVVWVPCALLRKVVHGVGDRLLDRVDVPGVTAAAVLLGVLAAAGLLRGLLHRFAPWRDVERDGIDVALRHYRLCSTDDPGPRYAVDAFGLLARKALATFVTLASGGSGGLEGPVVLIGEAGGAGVARVMGTRTTPELKTYQLAGIAAAISTLLSAPFAAALFSIEIVYSNRIVYRKLAYCLLAATVAYVLNTQLFGHDAAVLIAPSRPGTYSLSEYVGSSAIAIAVSAPLALGFGLAMKHARTLIGRVNAVARGVVGGLGTGVVAIGLSGGLGLDPRHVLGMGDWTLRELLAHGAGVPGGVWLLIVIVLGKMLTTAFTVQSGGSAGLLFPSMMLGGVAGAATARALALVGVVSNDDVSLFVVVGVASALVALVGVPMAAIAMSLELFGPQYGPPTILACGLTYVFTLRLSVYERGPPRPLPVAATTPPPGSTTPSTPPPDSTG